MKETNPYYLAILTQIVSLASMILMWGVFIFWK